MPEDDYDLIADMAGHGGQRREAREVLLAALTQARALTAIVNTSLKVINQLKHLFPEKCC